MEFELAVSGEVDAYALVAVRSHDDVHGFHRGVVSRRIVVIEVSGRQTVLTQFVIAARHEYIVIAVVVNGNARIPVEPRIEMVEIVGIARIAGIEHNLDPTADARVGERYGALIRICVSRYQPPAAFCGRILDVIFKIRKRDRESRCRAGQTGYLQRDRIYADISCVDHVGAQHTQHQRARSRVVVVIDRLGSIRAVRILDIISYVSNVIHDFVGEPAVGRGKVQSLSAARTAVIDDIPTGKFVAAYDGRQQSLYGSVIEASVGKARGFDLGFDHTFSVDKYVFVLQCR